MNRHKCAQVYLDALPIAGVDGTLKSRMKGTPAAGNVRAKTGTLRWANSMSGHVTTAAGEHLVFSLMVNRYYESRPARGDLDTIGVLLASFTGRTGE
jgi:D-alanyl-D-alanine carboxypeptidase/D-alanyl-D-alanine-endopeptidase (penicillin-binding protein 4)